MIIIALIITILEVSSAEANNSAACNRYCGTTSVQYPFGFTEGCEIRLNCTPNKNIQIGDFQVQNITTDNILVNLPAKCDRHILEIDRFFNQNYAPTWRNNFLLRNCRPQLNGCVIQGSLLEDRFSIPRCKSDSGNISCYSEEDIGLKLMSLKNLNRANCTVLFTSIAVDSIENRSMNSAVELKFQSVELEWWLKGSCSCVREANCVNVTLASGEMRFRCRCKEGFKGDGFTAGDGCRKG